MDEMVDRLLDILADKLTERLSAGHKELYTAKELAERYGVSCATIRSKMAAGEFGELVSVGERTRLVPWAGVHPNAAPAPNEVQAVQPGGKKTVIVPNLSEQDATTLVDVLKDMGFAYRLEDAA